MTIKTLMQENRTYFQRGNKEFFCDLDYRIQHTGKRKPVLVTKTFAWTDMFDQPRKLHYRIHLIEKNYKIGKLLPNIFYTQNEVDRFLKTYPLSA